MLYMFFIIPMSISAISSSLTVLKMPSKLVSLLILTYRYIFLLQERFLTAQKSMLLRRTEHNDKESWRYLSAIFVSSMVRAVFRGEKIWIAMSARGFEGSFPVTVSFRWKIRDTILFATCLLCFFVVLLRGKW
jgi:cobalt/nickel transport system permease protein